MKKIIILFVFTLCSYGINAAEKTPIVSDWIEEMSSRLNDLRELVFQDFDILSNQKIQQLDVAFQNLSFNLRKDLNKEVSRITGPIKDAMEQFGSLMEMGIDVIEKFPEELKLALSYNLKNLCDGTILCNIDPEIEYFEGLTQLLDPNALFYAIAIKGNAISNESITYIKVNNSNSEIPASSILSSSSNNQKNFRIEPSILNKLFKDTIPDYTDLQIVVKNGKKKFLSKKIKFDSIVINTQILLLPKKPFKLVATESFLEEKWVECETCTLSAEGVIRSTRWDDIVPFKLDSTKRFAKILKYKLSGGHDRDGAQYFEGDRWYYLFACNKDNVELFENGTKANLKCRYLVQLKRGQPPFGNANLYNTQRTLLNTFDNNNVDPRFFTTTIGGRLEHSAFSISAVAQYDIRKNITSTRTLKLNRSIDLDESNSSYGTFFSETIKSSASEITVNVIPLYIKNPKPEPLSRSKKSAIISGLFEVKYTNEETRIRIDMGKKN